MLYSTLCYLERGDEYLMLHRANYGIPLRGRLLQGRKWKVERLWKRTARPGATDEDFTGILEVSSTVLSTERPRILERRCRKRMEGPPSPVGCPGNAHSHDEDKAGGV